METNRVCYVLRIRAKKGAMRTTVREFPEALTMLLLIVPLSSCSEIRGNLADTNTRFTPLF